MDSGRLTKNESCMPATHDWLCGPQVGTRITFERCESSLAQAISR